MIVLKTISKFVLACFLISAGVGHFIKVDFYLKMMPPELPWHLELVYLSGVAEVVLGVLLLVPQTSRLAAWGIITLLIAIFPANVYLYQHQELIVASPRLAPAMPTLHLLRLPLQGVFILWAYWYTRRNTPDAVQPPS